MYGFVEPELMKQLSILLVFCILNLSLAQSACNDSLYVALKGKNLDSLSQNQMQYMLAQKKICADETVKALQVQESFRDSLILTQKKYWTEEIARHDSANGTYTDSIMHFAKKQKVQANVCVALSVALCAGAIVIDIISIRNDNEAAATYEAARALRTGH